MKTPLVILSLVLTTSIFLTGCGCQSPEEIEKANFISANQELACETVKNPDIAIQTASSKNTVKEIFQKNNFNIENDEEMLALFDKYEFDTEVQEEINDYLDNECEAE